MRSYVMITAWLAASSVSVSVSAQTSLSYEGSSTIGKFISDASDVYSQARFTLNTIPESAGGEQCAARQRCDVGGVARKIAPAFLERGVVETLIAKDAIAALVHKDNPINELTKEQLRGIFSGNIKNWSEVGGNDAAIRVFVVKEASATRQVFADAILDGNDYGAAEVITPDARMLPTISRDVHAIGQLSFAFLDSNFEVKPLTIDGQMASVENSDYPISRPLYLATYGEPKGAVKDFLDWTLSPAGQTVIKKRFIGVK
jgi:phosphate transport system substrate-binding protein